MTRQIQLLDVVALLNDRQDLGLVRGQVGTVVEVYEPTVFEVEFNDVQGCPYASEAVSADELMVLHHQLVSKEDLASLRQDSTGYWNATQMIQISSDLDNAQKETTSSESESSLNL